MVSGKVNPETGMLEYLSLPETDRLVREKCPIHDIASVWAVEVLGHFPGQEGVAATDSGFPAALRR